MNERPVHMVPPSGNYAKCGQKSKSESDYYIVGARTQNGVDIEPQGPQFVAAQVDFCKSRTSVITVKKTVKEPQPAQRRVSLKQLQASSHSSFKRYSCPPIGICFSQSQSSSSSSASSSSCSSSPPVPTSVITGHDPLGWKFQPRSRSRSSRNHTRRLSLQIPQLDVPTPSSPSLNLSPKTKLTHRPKPSPRHHSEPSTLRVMEKALPVMAPEELCAVHLRATTLGEQSDEVFNDSAPEKRRDSASPALPHKVPPPVPLKTALTRQIAHAIGSSRRCLRLVSALRNNHKNTYSSVTYPTSGYSPHIMSQNNICTAEKVSAPDNLLYDNLCKIT
ncbi:transcript variant X3 [Nothobranchius furzeri]|uniref:Transcript variant X3 n=1 Tax=Nothobranchius furzeri TaxID=105023 RepID=A0A9D2XMH7_NOTFU|nr:transcript variant X3 [Nothobranchius furzeri]